MEFLLKQMILAFITAGGCGYANYYILDNLNKINISENDSNDKVFVLGLFSLINLLLCFLFTDVLKWNLVASVASTLVLTIFLSFTLSHFIFFFKLYLSFTLLSFCLLFFWFFFYFLSWDFPYNRIIYHMIFNIFYINF